MEAYYDYKLKETKNKTSFFLRAFVMLFLFSFIFFANATPLSKPSQTEFGTTTAIKTAFSFLKNDEGYPIKGEKEDRINILFLGIPGKGNSAPNLTDSIMLISIKPSTNQLSILSIPRDLLVYIESEKRYSKINSLFIANEKDPELIKNKIEEITGEKIHNYITLNISAVEKIIDSLGGLNVFVEKDIYDKSFPTANFGTETFELKKGWRYLDGKTAIKYARTRHSENGDFDRMKQQQAIMEAFRKKIFGLNLILDLPTILSTLNTISKNIQTDISSYEIKKLYTLLKNVSYDKVKVATLTGNEKDSLLISDSFMFGKTRAFILKPKKGDFDYSEIQKLSKNIFNFK